MEVIVIGKDQSFYYEFMNDELVMYLADAREGYITRIPSMYNGLCKHIKSAQINTLWTLEDIIIRNKLKWINFEDL